MPFTVSRLAFLGLLLLSPLARADTFAKGGDVGWLQQMEASGFIFRDANGKPADCLKILKDHGMDTLRLRVWVNPSQDPRSGHCSRDEVAVMAERAHKAGFRIMIDFHCSDTWADPSHQAKPAAWAAHDFDQLKNDVFNHTTDVLKAIKARGVTPEWVQVGNEIANGMLWPDGHFPKNAKNLAELINEGHRAVKAINPRIKVIVHLDGGHDNARFRWFFDQMEKHGTKYDIIGLSYYPWWQKDKKDFRQSIDDLGKNLTDMASRYQRPVMVVEVGGEDSQPAETRAMLEAVIRKVRAVPEHKGLGVIYWEPQAAPSWSHYKLSCWNNDGRPTEALEAFLERGHP